MNMIPDDLSIPEFLRQEDSPARRAQRTRIANEMRRGATRRIETTSGRSTVSAGHAANLDETGKALLKEVKQNEREKTKKRIAGLRALPKKGNTMSKTVGKKEQALREKRTDGSKAKPKLSELAATLDANKTAGGDAAIAAAAPKAAAAKTAKATKTAKPAQASGTRPDGLKAGTKLAKLLDAAVAAGTMGATEAELCKKLGGWKKCRVTLRRVVERVGGKLTTVDGRLVVTLKKAA